MQSAAEIAWLIPLLPLCGALASGLGLIGFNQSVNKLKKPVAIGHSMGAIILLMVEIQQPGTFKKILLGFKHISPKNEFIRVGSR